MLQEENTNVIEQKTSRRRFLICCFFKSSRLINALLKNGRGSGRGGLMSIFSHIATKPLYFDMACREVFAWGNQCKFICISSNRSLSILPKRLMLVMASCRTCRLQLGVSQSGCCSFVTSFWILCLSVCLSDKVALTLNRGQNREYT